MAKNFAAIYNGDNPSSALNQSFFVKEEVVKGVGIVPAAIDFLYTVSGGTVTFTQPKESSAHRSKRHNRNFIVQKTATEWSMPMYFNIDEDAIHTAQVDPAVRCLMRNMLGRETNSGTSYDFDAVTDPSKTMTIFANLDVTAEQVVGAVVESAELTFPGDGQAQATMNGFAKFVYHAGISKSVTANAANIVTVAAGEAYRFEVGAYVMIVEADGVTRSADTPTGSARRITAVDTVANTVTLDGAVLADADGTTDPVYLCYYEPVAPTGIDNPITGLVGSIAIDSMPDISCMRSMTVSITNNHEQINYCFGKAGLGDKVFVAGGRLDVTVSLELNLDADLAGWMQRLREFEAHDISLVLGNSSKRHLNILLPKVIFDVPSISVPESGAVPVTFEGLALESDEEAGDEITISYK